MRYYWNLTPTELGKVYQQIKLAIRLGKLIPKDCEIKNCNVAKENCIAHHEDYDKPLEIKWLCKSHHRERHVQLNSIRPKNYLLNPQPKLEIPIVNVDRIKLWPDGYKDQTSRKFMAHFPNICYCKDCTFKRKEKQWENVK